MVFFLTLGFWGCPPPIYILFNIYYFKFIQVVFNEVILACSHNNLPLINLKCVPGYVWSCPKVFSCWAIIGTQCHISSWMGREEVSFIFYLLSKIRSSKPIESDALYLYVWEYDIVVSLYISKYFIDVLFIVVISLKNWMWHFNINLFQLAASATHLLM